MDLANCIYPNSVQFNQTHEDEIHNWVWHTAEICNSETCYLGLGKLDFGEHANKSSQKQVPFYSVELVLRTAAFIMEMQ